MVNDDGAEPNCPARGRTGRHRITWRDRIALRRPNDVLMWLSTAPEGERSRVIELLRDGFESLEEDFAEEQFFATMRASYWKEAEGSSARTLVATLIEKLEF